MRRKIHLKASNRCQNQQTRIYRYIMTLYVTELSREMEDIKKYLIQTSRSENCTM